MLIECQTIKCRRLNTSVPKSVLSMNVNVLESYVLKWIFRQLRNQTRDSSMSRHVHSNFPPQNIATRLSNWVVRSLYSKMNMRTRRKREENCRKLRTVTPSRSNAITDFKGMPSSIAALEKESFGFCFFSLHINSAESSWEKIYRQMIFGAEPLIITNNPCVLRPLIVAWTQATFEQIHYTSIHRLKALT